MADYVTYTDEDKAIVRRGISAIREVLMGADAGRKRRIMFCLEYFMDPYYGEDISQIHDELVELLEEVIVSPNEDIVIEDALDLLISYEWPPFPILEKNIDVIPPLHKPSVLYLLNLKDQFMKGISYDLRNT